MAESSRRSERTLRGTRDWLAADMLARQYVVRVIQDTYESFGYAPLGTPAIEYRDVLYSDESNTAREIFEVTLRTREGQAAELLGLRYDHTVPLARVVAQHHRNLPMPYKRYAIGPVWRAEQPQHGRLREFWQADADAVGAHRGHADAEIVAILDAVIRKLGLVEYEILINDRLLLDAVARELGVPDRDSAESVFRTWDKLEKTERETIERELQMSLAPSVATAVIEFTYSFLAQPGHSTTERLEAIDARFPTPNIEQTTTQVRQLLDMIEATGIRRDTVLFSPALTRGFSYYTGPIFEVRSTRVGVGSFAGGGRFDKLIQRLGGPDLPAVGASFGLERLTEVLREFGLVGDRKSNTEVLIAVVDPSRPNLINRALQLAGESRLLGYNTETYAGQRALSAQLAYANNLRIPATVILGERELESGTVIVRDVLADFSGDKRSNQVTVPEADLAIALQNIFRR